MGLYSPIISIAIRKIAATATQKWMSCPKLFHEGNKQWNLADHPNQTPPRQKGPNLSGEILSNTFYTIKG